MEVSDVRRRLRGALEDAKRRSAERRTLRDDAARAWGQVLASVAVPSFNMMSAALTGEGHPFKVFTPGEAVRLQPDRTGDEYIELSLDTTRELPAVVMTSRHGRGRRTYTGERIVAEGPAIAQLSDDEVVSALLAELAAFLER